MKRVVVTLRVDGGLDRGEIPRAGRFGPLEIVRTQHGLGTGGAIAELDVVVPTQHLGDREDELAAIESAASIVRAEVGKRGWQLDGCSVSVVKEPKWAP